MAVNEKAGRIAAYLHLAHQMGERTAKTVPQRTGSLVVDYSSMGRAVGIEIAAPYRRRSSD